MRYTQGEWTFEATLAPIAARHKLLALARRLADPYAPGDTAPYPYCVKGATRSLKPCTCGSALVMGVKMHLPDATFADNHLTITHTPTKTTFTFRAEDALAHWARHSLEHGSRALRVAAAKLPAWERQLAEAEKRSSIDYDWTFGVADYAGRVTTSSASTAVATSAATSPACAARAAPCALAGCSIVSLGRFVPQVEPLVAPPPPLAVSWTPHRGPGLGPMSPHMPMLLARDPILWSAEVPLFEDTLHDSGESQLSVRIRVMRGFFLVMLRHHVRVDGVTVQQREVRLFHKFGDGHVLRTRRAASLPLEPLPPAGVPYAVPPPLMTEPEAAARLAQVSPDEQSAEELELESLGGDAGRAAAEVAAALPPAAEPAASARLAFEGGDEAPAALATHGSSLVAVGGMEGTLVVLRLASEASARPRGDVDEVWRCRGGSGGRGHRGPITCLRFVSGGANGGELRLASSGEDGRCALWDVPTSEAAAAAAAAAPVERAPARLWLLEGASADRVRLGGSGESAAIVQTLAAEPGGGGGGGDCRRLAAASGSSVFLLDADAAHPAAQLAAPAVVTALGYAREKRLLLAAGFGGLTLWADMGRGASSRLRFFGPIDTLAIGADERYVGGGAQDNTLVVWPLPTPAAAAAAADDDDDAASDAAESGDAIELDWERPIPAGGSTLFCGGFEHKVGPVVWGAGGRVLAAAGGRSVVAWDFDGEPPVRQNGRSTLLGGHSAPVVWLGFAPAADGAADAEGGRPSCTLATASADGRVLVFRLGREAKGRVVGAAKWASPVCVWHGSGGSGGEGALVRWLDPSRLLVALADGSLHEIACGPDQ